ncbi:DUF4439 domain-containing protein [Arthrobacter globiformis]|uniref:DUF4439 domain-containing protein n=1 Tax=Arthrobacter globiformis TaxID=1665 RepID=UPI002791AC2B|nr:DUF4439 domain-containing protein [Arthrobacter globiformis]MDQ0617761.1 hypothetical protein [Arthrobacter globiformis]
MTTSVAIFRAAWCTDFHAAVTTWSVVNDDSGRKRRTASYLRYGLLALAAFLVLSLGFALVPRESPAPAAPPFSEQARAAALAQTLDLRAASQQLADGSSGARRQLFSHTVTLLTTQARALLLPGGATATSAAGAGSTAGAPGTAGPSATASSGSAPSRPATLPALIAALSKSGKERLVHAEKADGGMARLLAAVGTAQLLQATTLAQVAGTPPPTLSAPATTQRNAATACSATSPSGGSAQSGNSAEAGGDAQPSNSGQSTKSAEPSDSATLAAALNRVVRTEVETVYGYQVALTRLAAPAADQARALLATHETLVGQAEAYTRAHCVSVPPREPGYTLGTSFLQKPAAGLASLEAGTLPVYGDLVALSEGETRRWAVSSLVAAAQRTTRWGSDPGPVPGIVLDTALLPELPEPPAPSPRQTDGGAA